MILGVWVMLEVWTMLGAGMRSTCYRVIHKATGVTVPSCFTVSTGTIPKMSMGIHYAPRGRGSVTRTYMIHLISLKDRVGPGGPGTPLTPGFEAPKLSFLGPSLIFLYFF